ncbi:MAG: hypothetical protein ACRC18_13315 [Cetobacterium sp.]
MTKTLFFSSIKFVSKTDVLLTEEQLTKLQNYTKDFISSPDLEDVLISETKKGKKTKITKNEIYKSSRNIFKDNSITGTIKKEAYIVNEPIDDESGEIIGIDTLEKDVQAMYCYDISSKIVTFYLDRYFGDAQFNTVFQNILKQAILFNMKGIEKDFPEFEVICTPIYSKFTLNNVTNILENNKPIKQINIKFYQTNSEDYPLEEYKNLGTSNYQQIFKAEDENSLGINLEGKILKNTINNIFELLSYNTETKNYENVITIDIITMEGHNIGTDNKSKYKVKENTISDDITLDDFKEIGLRQINRAVVRPHLIINN